MKPAQLLQHFDRISDAPDAIPRLRRFILDLAVRGKLVEQDPTDEPAAKLLERIAAEKARLVTARATRKQKTAQVLDDPLPILLPKGWSCAPLGDLVAVLNGRAYSQNELLDVGTPVLRVGNLFTSNKWYYSNLTLDDDKHCDEGDLIFSWSASFGPFIWRGPRVIYHYHIWKLDLYSQNDLDKFFIYNFLRQKTQQIKNDSHGVSMVHMTKQKMEAVAVPLPPLAEQHRIVAKVDELMVLCDRLEAARNEREARRDRLLAASLHRLNQPQDSGDTQADAAALADHARFHLNHLSHLSTRPDHIKSLRQTILNLAVRGKLVEQDPADEPAPHMLKQIATRKSELERLGDIPVRRSSTKALGVRPNAPKTWALSTFGSVCNVVTSGSRGWAEYYSEAGPSLIRAQNIRFGRLHLDELAYVNPPISMEASRTRTEKGDILIVITGAGVTTPALLTSDLGEAYVSQHVALAKPTDPDMARWLLLWLMANRGGRSELVERAYGSGKPGLNLDNIRSLALLVPPLAEQHRIVARVDELMALCDRLEASLSTQEDTSRRLLESVLHHALAPALEEVAA
ncbi:MAG: hypothetical protein VR70_10080 [Rhodospirillaceae bacterium BRH_c57]|nr:MAG: hypothetical protein VR70_10080 [Rhodospirillaceae bacterium BRH_c57]